MLVLSWKLRLHIETNISKFFVGKIYLNKKIIVKTVYLKYVFNRAYFLENISI